MRDSSGKSVDFIMVRMDGGVSNDPRGVVKDGRFDMAVGGMAITCVHLCNLYSNCSNWTR